MLVRALLSALLAFFAVPCMAGWGSIQYGETPSPDGIYLLAPTAGEVCAKYNNLHFNEADWGFSRMYFKLEPSFGPSGGVPSCVMYTDAAFTDYWGDWFQIMDCTDLPNPFGSSWVCPSGESPLGWGVASYGPWESEEPTMSVGWITDLTPEQGGQIAGAILAIWAFGWGIRVLIRTLNTVDGETQSESE